jgi:dihydropteroate synthase
VEHGQTEQVGTGYGQWIDVSSPRVMAILNVTPDSFSDGGKLGSIDAIVRAAVEALDAGASVLDVGGESTRPGAVRVDADEQIARVVPAIRAIRDALLDRGAGPSHVPISIDTTLAPVARAALDAGATIINDVSGGLEDPSILTLAAERRAGLILMHRERAPDQDRYSTAYESGSAPIPGDVVAHVERALRSLLESAIRAGVNERSIILDPGLGFGKTVGQNLELIRGTERLLAIGRPLLSALSRKSFVGALSAAPGQTLGPESRLGGTIALTLEHLRRGVRLFRVHDVRPVAEAIRAAWAADGRA